MTAERRTEPHAFKDEWSFQRSMSRGNPMAGKPIGPRQPCFTCGVRYADHARVTESEDALREAADWLNTMAKLVFERRREPDLFDVVLDLGHASAAYDAALAARRLQPADDGSALRLDRWIDSLHEDTHGLVWITKDELRAARGEDRK